MKFKKIMLAMLLLLAILTIGAVSASQDINVTDELAASDEAVDVQLPQEDFDEVLSDDAISDETLTDDGDDEEEDDGYFTVNDCVITFREIAMLRGDKVGDQPEGKIVIINKNIPQMVFFNKNVCEMEYNYQMMGYIYNQYDGYVIFKEDLENATTGKYDLIIQYKDDNDNVIESVETTVYLDYDSHVTDEEVDLNQNEFVMSAYIFSDYDNGALIIDWHPTEEDDDEGISSGMVVNITQDMYGQTLTFTRDDFGLDEPGEYRFHVIYCSYDEYEINYYDDIESIPEECESVARLIDGSYFGLEAIGEDAPYWGYRFIRDDVTVVDNTKFRVKVETTSILDSDGQLLVYCPEGNVGDTIFIVANGYEINFTITDQYAGHYAGFPLDYFEFNDAGEYEFDLYDEDGDSLIDTYCYEFDNPIRLREMVIIGADDIFDSAVVYVIVPEGTQGEVVIEDDEGNQLFYMDSIGYLRLVTDREQVDYQFEDEPLKRYYVINDDLTAPQQGHSFNNTIFKLGLDAGTYYLTATLTTGGKVFTSSEEVRFVERNYVERNGVRIELFDYEEHRFCDEEDRIAKVTAEQYGDYDPSTDNPRIEVNLIGEEYDNIYTFYLDEDDGAYSVSIWIDDEELAPGDYEVIVSYYFNEDDDDPLVLSSYMTFVGHDDEDGPLEEIEFNMLYDEDGESVFENGDDVTVAYLLIPESQNDDADVTITVTRNGQHFATIFSTEIETEYIESREAYQYPINLDLTQLEDKDLLEFNVNCFDEDDAVLTYGIEVNDDDNEVIFHYYLGIPEFYVFYGNVTTGDLNNPEMMGPRPNGDFIEFSVPDAYNVSEGSIVVSDGDTVILNKSFDDFEEVGYDYSVLGNAYTITLDEFDLMALPENSAITVSLNYGSDSLTFKRIRVADYVYKLVTPDDVAILYDVEITDDVISNIDDVVVSIVALDANRQSIYIDIGGGHFSVYVNGVKVENLGEKLLYAWIYQSGILDVDELSEDDDYYWQLNEMEIDIDEYLNSDIDDRVSMLYDIAVDEFGSELELFRMTSYNMGCPEFYLSAADLGITESGTYNIKLTHIPDEAEETEPGEIPPDDYVVHEETLVIEKNVTVGSELSDPSLVVIVNDIAVGESAVVNVTLDESIDGTVTVNDMTITVTDGIGSLILDNLAVGQYDVTAVFEGNAYFYPAMATATFRVNKADPSIAAVYNGESGELVATLTSSVTGKALTSANVVVSLNGADYALKTNSKGQAKLSVPDLAPGVYTATVSYKGNAKYNPASADVVVSLKSDASIAAVYDNVSGELVATLTNAATGKALTSANVVVSLNGVNYALKTNSKGQAKLSVPDLAPGVYTATVSYKGNAKYNPASADVVVNTKLDSSISAVYDSGSNELVATLTNAATGKALTSANVVVSLNGVNYALKTNSKGQAKLSVPDLAPGVYTATVSYKGNAKYNPTSADVVVSLKSDASIAAVYDSESGELVATLTNAATGKALTSANVVVSLNGVNYALKTNSKGQAKLSVPDLAPGVYTATVSYKGNSKYNPASADVVVNTKLDSSISAVYDSGSNELVATLTNAATGKALTGANVVVSLNGVNYALKTNSKGQAKLSTADLDSGDYTASISYKGNSKYNPTSTTAEVVIE